jgi:hypothetical protein
MQIRDTGAGRKAQAIPRSNIPAHMISITARNIQGSEELTSGL